MRVYSSAVFVAAASVDMLVLVDVMVAVLVIGVVNGVVDANDVVLIVAY